MTAIGERMSINLHYFTLPKRRILRKTFVVILWLAAVMGLAQPKLAWSMEAKILQEDRVLGQPMPYSIFLSGGIEVGDAERIWNKIRDIPYEPGSTVNFFLDSPGGDLMESLKIGRMMIGLSKALPVTTTSNVKSFNNDANTAVCASACVFVYLGANYRFLDPGGRIGIHQFAYGEPDAVDSGMATAEAQVTAAMLSEYLRIAGVDQRFYTLMVSTDPNDINWVDRATLKALNVLNEHILAESSDYKNFGGHFYLRLSQQSMYGENKLLLLCDKGKVSFMSFLEPPEVAVNLIPSLDLKIVVDDQEVEPIVTQPPKASGKFIAADFVLGTDALQRLSRASVVGARMYLSEVNPIFFGFSMEPKDNKIAEFIGGCTLNPQ